MARSPVARSHAHDRRAIAAIALLASAVATACSGERSMRDDAYVRRARPAPVSSSTPADDPAAELLDALGELVTPPKRGTPRSAEPVAQPVETPSAVAPPPSSARRRPSIGLGFGS